ncbi:hypothetical protein SS50377_26606 [Spironucleus salmonicida]|uniref:Uncharacterized protein n=1 Tax=Spironucleus salmonicida TaxID=348837 RepID=V6LAL9_9EUKA|nr:hypothetical protein SS50377_26606 [Spironucleus salmonicida]|eukprot:EST41457.1 Hypothetical protein SS50377_19176 [Spironucleus salmonicida]
MNFANNHMYSINQQHVSNKIELKPQDDFFITPDNHFIAVKTDNTQTFIIDFEANQIIPTTQLVMLPTPEQNDLSVQTVTKRALAAQFASNTIKKRMIRSKALYVQDPTKIANNRSPLENNFFPFNLDATKQSEVFPLKGLLAIENQLFAQVNASTLSKEYTNFNTYRIAEFASKDLQKPNYINIQITEELEAILRDYGMEESQESLVLASLIHSISTSKGNLQHNIDVQIRRKLGNFNLNIVQQYIILLALHVFKFNIGIEVLERMGKMTSLQCQNFVQKLGCKIIEGYVSFEVGDVQIHV